MDNADIRFGSGGNAAGWMLDGWSEPERRFTWSVGDESRLRLPPFAGKAPHGLEITLSPNHHRPSIALQSLRIAGLRQARGRIWRRIKP